MSRSTPTVPIRRGFSTRKLLVALALVLALPALGFSLWSKFSWSKPGAGPMMCRVERGEFIHEITDRGNVESANNVEIRCQVKSKGTGGTTILEIVSEGTTVQPGDVLVRLDSSALENERTAQLIGCNNSKAAMIQAQEAYDTAVIAKREYLEGLYRQAAQTIQNEIFMAEENMSRAEEYLKYSERLAAKGYITKQQLKADRFAVDQARNSLEIAKTKLDVLQRFTKEKMIVQLSSNIKTAEASAQAKQAAHKLDMGQLDLIKSQIEKCVIRSPEAGQVVYANVTGWRGSKEVIIEAGEQARERQALIRLPDPKRMQVVAKINESKITLVKRGMPATVRLDAFPELELHGTVEKVDEFPVPTSFFGSSVKEYETTVRINESPPGLRPGLTAEVRIRAEYLPDVLLVPVQAVFEQDEKFYCVTGEGNRWYAREVTIGATNDKAVVVQGGLFEGEEVVLNAAAYREKVDLSETALEPQAVTAPAAKRAADADRAAAKNRAADAEKMFRQFDGNGDGTLQLDELPEGLRDALKAADGNNDGEIDQAEWIAAAKRFRNQGDGPAKPRAQP
ncbi:MAG: efflux RND transporter periplasmic adaptor subunit [Pirellulales bacterium]|nr:efflux RND transporter periplasmic adaptor subunit [Pirellulales bacterium]